jgi:hypothetical protein
MLVQLIRVKNTLSFVLPPLQKRQPINLLRRRLFTDDKNGILGPILRLTFSLLYGLSVIDMYSL